jgi:CRP-like cAMP-binding protein
MKRLLGWWRNAWLRDSRLDETPVLAPGAGLDGVSRRALPETRGGAAAGAEGSDLERAEEGMFVLTDASVDGFLSQMLICGLMMLWLWWVSAWILDWWRDRAGQTEPGPDDRSARRNNGERNVPPFYGGRSGLSPRPAPELRTPPNSATLRRRRRVEEELCDKDEGTHQGQANPHAAQARGGAEMDPPGAVRETEMEESSFRAGPAGPAPHALREDAVVPALRAQDGRWQQQGTGHSALSLEDEHWSQETAASDGWSDSSSHLGEMDSFDSSSHLGENDSLSRDSFDEAAEPWRAFMLSRQGMRGQWAPGSPVSFDRSTSSTSSIFTSDESGQSDVEEEEAGGEGVPRLKRASWCAFPLFHGLSEATVDKLLRTMKTCSFKTGDTIITRGTIGTTMYLIDYGTASAMVEGVEATKLSSGDCFGEMSFIATCRRFMKNQDESLADTDVIRTADVVATSSSRMVELSVRNFLTVMKNDSESNQLVLLALSAIADERKSNLQRMAQAASGAASSASDSSRSRLLSLCVAVRLGRGGGGRRLVTRAWNLMRARHVLQRRALVTAQLVRYHGSLPRHAPLPRLHQVALPMPCVSPAPVRLHWSLTAPSCGLAPPPWRPCACRCQSQPRARRRLVSRYTGASSRLGSWGVYCRPAGAAAAA